MSESQLKSEIEALREILASLRVRLEASEEFRALRQLDERERNGNPLQSIDGVPFRGRLVRRLEENSRTWRAYVRLEEAVAHLEGADKLEPGIISGNEAARRAAIAEMVPSATPRSAHGASEHDGQASPLSVRETVSHLPPGIAPNTGQKEVAAPAGREPRVSITPAIPVAPAHAGSPSGSTEPHRTVLDRIRLVSSVSAKPTAEAVTEQTARDAIGSGRLVDPLPPAIDETRVARLATPTGNATAQDASIETAAAGAPVADMPSHAAAGAAVPPARETTKTRHDSSARIAPAPDGKASVHPARLDELESELARLIRHDGAARFPGPSPEMTTQEAANPLVTSLEPDILDDLGPDADVEEAEVTIVRLAEPSRDGAIRPSPPAPIATSRRPVPSLVPDVQTGQASALAGRRIASTPRPATLSGNKSAETKTALTEADSEDDALSADVEEADVEIVVPSGANGAAGGRSRTSRRDPD